MEHPKSMSTRPIYQLDVSPCTISKELKVTKRQSHGELLALLHEISQYNSVTTDNSLVQYINRVTIIKLHIMTK